MDIVEMIRAREIAKMNARVEKQVLAATETAAKLGMVEDKYKNNPLWAHLPASTKAELLANEAGVKVGSVKALLGEEPKTRKPSTIKREGKKDGSVDLRTIRIPMLGPDGKPTGTECSLVGKARKGLEEATERSRKAWREANE